MKLKLTALFLIVVGLSVYAYPKSHGHHFVTPSKSTCLRHGGRWNSNFHGSCEASLYNAKKICRANGGRVPTQHEFERLIRLCGGTVHIDGRGDSSINRNSWSYKRCYREHGLDITRSKYWTSTKYKWNHLFRRTVDIESGIFSFRNSSSKSVPTNAVACIR